MKTKINLPSFCMFLASLWVSSHALAQPPKGIHPAKPLSGQITEPPGNDSYTYRLFIAPNKVYGYDLFRNGRLIFHQPAAAEPAGSKKTGLTTKAAADKAALLAMEKIKKGQSPALTREEVMKIATQ